MNQIMIKIGRMTYRQFLVMIAIAFLLGGVIGVTFLAVQNRNMPVISN